MAWLLTRTTGEVLARRPRRVPRGTARLHHQRLGRAVGAVGRSDARRAGRDVGDDLRRQSARAGVRRVAWDAAAGASGSCSSKIRHVAKAALLGRRLRREYGVQGTGIIGLMFGSSDLNIVYTSRHFQPCAESFDDRFQFIGPSVDLRSEPASASVGRDVAGTDVIYVSLGTLFNADPAFYRNLLRRVRRTGCPRCHVHRHRHQPKRASAPPPANVVVKPWVSQLDVLRRTSVFVSHGGMNSVSESLLPRRAAGASCRRWASRRLSPGEWRARGRSLYRQDRSHGGRAPTIGPIAC